MRMATLVAVIALIAGACGGSGNEPLSLDQYVASIQAVEDRFTEESTQPGQNDYQLEGELVGAESLFSDFEARLRGWKDIEPPDEVANSMTSW